MGRKVILIISLILVLLVSVLPTAQASLLVSTGGQFLGYGYGNYYWDNMTEAMNNACSNISTADNFENLAQMLSYDAIWLDARSPGGLLSATELTNIGEFITTGRRVVLMGENDSWTGWDNQILGLVGSSFAGNVTGTSNPILNNQLTAGVSTVTIPTGGSATGGAALFDKNFATLWGGNVLTVLDINVFSDDYWGSYNNAVFARNVADWVCAAPIPGTCWLLGLGLTGLLAGRRKWSS